MIDLPGHGCSPPSVIAMVGHLYVGELAVRAPREKSLGPETNHAGEDCVHGPGMSLLGGTAVGRLRAKTFLDIPLKRALPPPEAEVGEPAVVL